MNSKTVLHKIMEMLSLSSDTIEMTYAKLKDGTIVESKTFDVGETLDVVSEDGTKTPAPNGEHELALRDAEGNETIIKVITEAGIITERENVELASVLPVEAVPQGSGDIKKENEVPTQTNSIEDGTQLAEVDEEVEIPIEAPEKEVDMNKKMEDLAYRIEEMEKKMQEMVEQIKPKAEETEMKKVDNEDLPKLDGAPIESANKFSAINTNKTNKKVYDAQSNFLSKLYN